MSWRYRLAHNLAFITLIISVIRMILLPWSSRSPGDSPAEPEDGE